MSRANWGKAKLIVSALRSDIERLYSEDLNLEEIFQHLRADGKITIARRTFKRHASDIIKDTRTLTLKRLLNEEIITPDEFKTRIEARLGALPSPSSQSPQKKIPVTSRPPAVEPSSETTKSQTSKAKPKVISTFGQDRFGHNSKDADDAVSAAYGLSPATQTEDTNK
jgi:hypothetical protein